MRFTLFVTVVALLVLAGTQAHADTIAWTDFTSATSGTATGNMTIGSSTVTVDYTGHLYAADLNGSGWWTEGTPAPYTGNSVIDNGPLGQDCLRFYSAASNTLTFSEALVDPVMAIVSMGSPSLAVTYDFDTPFTLLSEGRGYWGDGSYSLGAGDVLVGVELHAAIQFTGTLTSISWTSTTEGWHGIQIGAASAAAIPEPASGLLLLTGVAGLLAARRRRGRG